MKHVRTGAAIDNRVATAIIKDPSGSRASHSAGAATIVAHLRPGSLPGHNRGHAQGTLQYAADNMSVACVVHHYGVRGALTDAEEP